MKYLQGTLQAIRLKVWLDTAYPSVGPLGEKRKLIWWMVTKFTTSDFTHYQ